MNSYYFGFATELDVDETSTMPIVSREKELHLHLDRWRTISKLYFCEALDRRGLLYTFAMVDSISRHGFSEFIYVIHVTTPADTSPETVAFLIRMDVGQFPMPEDWESLLAQGGQEKLRRTMQVLT